MSPLSPRQAEIARLIAEQDMSAKAIAKALKIAPLTVETHIRNGARRIEGPWSPRMKLARWWWENGEEWREAA